jgi:hypothetical protein
MHVGGVTGVESFVPRKQAGRRDEIIEIEESVVIHRPVREVFAFLADIENWTKLQLALRESEKTSPGPVRVGDTFLQTLDLAFPQAAGTKIGVLPTSAPGANGTTRPAKASYELRGHVRVGEVPERFGEVPGFAFHILHAQVTA